MYPIRMPSFNAVAPGMRSTSQVPNINASLCKIVLQLGGALTKANISEVSVKIGSRTVLGPFSGTIWDTLNKYRGIYDEAGFLTISLIEPDGMSQASKEEGAVDMRDLKGEGVFVEVVNTAGAAVTLSALAWFTVPQVRVIKGKDGKNMPVPANARLMSKAIPNTLTQSGTRVTWTPKFGGADIKRIHFHYPTGTDWGATTAGTIQELEVRKNGVTIFDRITCQQNRFSLRENKKTPQSKIYTFDPCADGVYANTIETAGAELQFDLLLDTSVPITALIEVYDLPGNL